MSESYASLDAHAYVDNSLSAADRAAFEAALRRDSKLRARVDAWQAQNDAIRLAFGATAKPRLAPSLGRHSNENGAAPKSAPPHAAITPQIVRTSRAIAEAPKSRVGGWGLATIAIFASLAAMLSFSGGPADPRDTLMDRAAAALRAVAPLSNTRLDFISDDPRAVSAWLAPRFARLDAARLAPPGWSLLGVRIVPGLGGPAAMVMFEDATGDRAALWLEPTDALPDLAPMGKGAADELRVAGVQRGFAYAVVGPRHSGVAALAPFARAE